MPSEAVSGRGTSSAGGFQNQERRNLMVFFLWRFGRIIFGVGLDIISCANLAFLI